MLIPALLVTVLAAPPAAAPKDAVKALQVWVQRQQRANREFDRDAEKQLIKLLDELRIVRNGQPERGQEVDLALLDLGGLNWLPRPERKAARAADDRRSMASSLGIERVEKRLNKDTQDELKEWLAVDVVARPKEHPTMRRVVAADLLYRKHAEGTLTALLASARDPDPLVRETVRRALAGWKDPQVHLFFLEQLERDNAPLSIGLEHLHATKGSLGPQALERLRSHVGKLYVSGDWRDAARAGKLVQILDIDRAAPILIESLATWTRRIEEGEGSRRIQHEIVEELQRVSGRSIGPFPERWNMWWKAVREGRIETAEEEQRDGGGGLSNATFFGLRPVTDKVIFVIDRSGSMQAGFGTTGRSRYEEAVEQMLTFLEKLGEETKFGVTLFNQTGTRWRTGLVKATKGNRTGIRRWLLGKKPDGGTQLREGIRTGLELTRDDTIDVRRTDADTVIVLCDGATAEGSGWVRPWLLRANDEAQLVFHCVQIGSTGDGTLETLAAETGGDYVRIDG